MLNIVVPLAGRGSRFERTGYSLPKPLIEIHGMPMIDLVVGNLRPTVEHRFLFLVLRTHLEQYGLEEHLLRVAPGGVVVPVEDVTQGAAVTVLLARDYISANEPLMIANTDQWVDVDIDEYLEASVKWDGLIMCMRADEPKWSYVGFSSDGLVNRVVEKEVISNAATVGIYNFAEARRFLTAADKMIAAGERVNGEFYVAPVYNYVLADGAVVGIYNVGSLGDRMYGLGTPQDLEVFLTRPISYEAVRRSRRASLA